MVVGEEAAEIGVFEGVIVGEGDLIDVVGVDEGLAWLVAGSIPSSVHPLRIISVNKFILCTIKTR